MEPNGAHNYRFDKFEKELSDMKSDLVAPINGLTDAVRALCDKIDTLQTTHMKIIYWLLLLVSSAFLGAKGLEIFKIVHP